MPDRQPTSTIRSIERALHVLEQLAAVDRELGLTELADAVGLSAGTTHRVLRTLVQHGYIRQLPSRDYTLGPGLVALGERARQGAGLGAESRLQALADRTGETAALATPDGSEVIFLAQATPRGRNMRVVVELGQRTSLGAPAIVDAILAARPKLAAHIRGDPQTTARLEGVRKRGYAVDNSRNRDGVWCMATGLARSALPGAVALIGPQGHPSLQNPPNLVRLLKETAGELESTLDLHGAETQSPGSTYSRGAEAGAR